MIKRLIENLIYHAYKMGRRIHSKRTYHGFYKKYGLPASFKFNGEAVKIYGEGALQIGENSYIGSYSTIQIQKNHKVKIGSNCRIGHNVRIYTTSVLSDQDFNLENSLESFSGNVEIGDAVWIGVNVFINPGTKIGNNVIVGANSVITHNIPDNAIVGGVPARLIRYKKTDA